MRFKELTEENKIFISSVYKNKDLSWDARMNELCSKFKASERTIRKWCSEKLGLKERVDGSGIVESDQYKVAQKKEFESKKYYLISYAQNNTPVHDKLLKKMEMYRDFLGAEKAEIIIIAGRYKNPTSIFSDAKEEFWCKEVSPYLTANIHHLNSNIKVCGNIKITPTATNPLQSMEGLSDGETCIFGHPRVHLDTMSTLPNSGHKLLLTSGACTVPNYTDSKAGHIGHFNHVMGFCMVEVKDDKTFFVRQVTAHNETGDFTDLYHKVDDNGVSRINSAEALVYGDIHVETCDNRIIEQTRFQLLEKLKFKSLIFHDLFDGHSISHHDEKDPFTLAIKEFNGTNSLRNEVNNMLKWLEQFELYDGNVVVVRSNHDLFFEKFLITDWRKNVKNSREYMEFSLALLSGKAKDGIIPYIISQRFPKFHCLGISDSYIVKGGFECGQHGMIGSNGSRGSILTFRKLVSKMITGHSHTPKRLDGAISAGTSTHLRLPYNEGGPSSWMQGHVLVHDDGRAQHILFINGEFTTFE